MIQKLIKLIKTFVNPININSKLYSKVYIVQNSVCFVSDNTFLAFCESKICDTDFALWANALSGQNI
jgi:hypothetical protein